MLRAPAPQFDALLRPDAHARGDRQVEARVGRERDQRVRRPEERDGLVRLRGQGVRHPHGAVGAHGHRAAERVAEPAPNPARDRALTAGLVGGQALGGGRLGPELAVVGERHAPAPRRSTAHAATVGRHSS